MQAAVAVARMARIAAGEPRVLHSGSSVIVGFDSAGLVARVGGLTQTVRDLHAHYARELQVAGWLTTVQAPVVHPWAPAGPFVHDGSVISFWRRAKTEPPAAPRAAGQALRECHLALRRFRPMLPPLRFLLNEAEVIARSVDLSSDDRVIFDHALAWAYQVIAEHGLPQQPVHGDAGMGNVLSDGVWHDWEDCCHGPVVWDLACLVSTARITGRTPDRAEATLAAYGSAPGLDRLDDFVAVRGLQVLAWSLLRSGHEPQPRPTTRRRLEWLRTHAWPG